MQSHTGENLSMKIDVFYRFRGMYLMPTANTSIGIPRIFKLFRQRNYVNI